MSARLRGFAPFARSEVVPTVVFFGLLIGIVLLGSQLLAVWWWPVRRFDLYTGAVGALFLAGGLLVGLRARGALRPRPLEMPSSGGPPAGPQDPLPPPVEALTPRELEILASLAAGCSNAEIADRHFVSLNTVKTHVRQIYGKLEVTRRVQAVTRARRMGLLD